MINRNAKITTTRLRQLRFLSAHLTDAHSAINKAHTSLLTAKSTIDDIESVHGITQRTARTGDAIHDVLQLAEQLLEQMQDEFCDMIDE